MILRRGWMWGEATQTCQADLSGTRQHHQGEEEEKEAGMGAIVQQDNKHFERKEEGEKTKPQDNSMALRIGTWNKSYHQRDMFADKRQDIEITLKNADMGVIDRRKYKEGR